MWFFRFQFFFWIILWWIFSWIFFSLSFVRILQWQFWNFNFKVSCKKWHLIIYRNKSKQSDPKWSANNSIMGLTRRIEWVFYLHFLRILTHFIAWICICHQFFCVGQFEWHSDTFWICHAERPITISSSIKCIDEVFLAINELVFADVSFPPKLIRIIMRTEMR